MNHRQPSVLIVPLVIANFYFFAFFANVGTLKSSECRMTGRRLCTVHVETRTVKVRVLLGCSEV